MFTGIDQSVIFALGSMFFAGVNDIVFKKQAISGLGRGQYLSIVGIVWMLVFTLIALMTGGSTITRNALFWGLIAGGFSISSNYLLVWSLRHLDASIGATIYRLNLILVVIIAVFWLDETLTLLKIIGLSFAGAAILLFSGKSSFGPKNKLKIQAFVLAFFASALRAGMGITYKLAAIDFHDLPVDERAVQNYWFIAVQGLIWFIAGLFISIRFENETALKSRNVGYGVLSGVLICGIVLFMAKSLAVGNASVAIPITQMSFLITSLISWPLYREQFSFNKVLALTLASAAIVFLTLNA